MTRVLVVKAVVRRARGAATPTVTSRRAAPAARPLRPRRRLRLPLVRCEPLVEPRERIEQHITEVLAPQGHVLLVTSRPADIDTLRYASFFQLSLSGLSPA